MFRKKSSIYLLSLFLIACNNEPLHQLADGTIKDAQEESQTIPLETALNTLSNFFVETKVGGMPEITSISNYCSGYPSTATKAVSSKLNSVPDAYLVNFGDKEGFAVLGAKKTVPSIVAVLDNGRIEDDLRIVIDDETEYCDDDDVDPSDFPEGFNGYCDEDDDYYCAAPLTANSTHIEPDYVKALIVSGISEGSSSPGSGLYFTPAPMLNYSWSQGKDVGEDYNRYCRRNDGRVAVTGCSTTAMAMIVAYNEFPQKVYITDSDNPGSALDWKNMKSGKDFFYLNDAGKDDVAKLMGSIFNHVTKLCFSHSDKTPKATSITAEQIKKRMKAFGYINVKRVDMTSITKDILRDISFMLGEGKPVFFSAIPNMKAGLNDIFKGHSWVIDGAKYSGSDYLLHFNFGWSGNCNGYFSYNCLCPSKAVEFDDLYSEAELGRMSEVYDYTYSFHFRMITYDIPSGEHSFSTTAKK